MRLFRKILLVFALGFLTCWIAFFAFFFSVTKSAKLNPEKLLLPTTQVSIYAESGEEIHVFGSFDKRSIVPIDSLPPYLPTAFINTEDRRFYQHNGFDCKGIVRAFLKNAKSKSFKEGASTISQQLIKNTHLTHEKTIKRKLQEVRLTMQLERKYSKEKILETYLNTIYFGHSCYGISDAAEFYFGKSAKELTLAESAMLAGLVKSPNNYSPFNAPEKAFARRKIILGLMKAQGSISENEYQNAVNAYLPTTYPKKAPHSYGDFCLQEMDKILESQGVPIRGKIELFTYFSSRSQSILNCEAELANTDKTLILRNNHTGGIEAVTSSVRPLRRQPGSLIKPLLIYAPAFEEGLLSPASPILDQPTDFHGYSPKNYNEEYLGYVSARTAIAKSLNIPAVKTLNSLGIEKAEAYAQKMNLPIENDDKNLSFALGGTTHGYTLQSLLDGYATLANDGFFQPSYFIKEIKTNGISLYRASPQKRSVFSPETAYLTTSTLLTAAKEGTAKKLRNLPFDVAAKTGTVGTKKGNSDAYTIAYTTNHSLGVWMGNADNSAIDATGGGIPCTICQNVLEKLYKNARPENFERPSGVKSYPIDLFTYQSEHRILLADQTAPRAYTQAELFWEKYAPTEPSNLFLRPCIQTPNIHIDGQEATISFLTPPPEFYCYKIVRRCNGKETVVYEGAAFQTFHDKALQANMSYEYTVIPYYQHTQGTPIRLPAIYVQEPAPPILDKPWWND